MTNNQNPSILEGIKFNLDLIKFDPNNPEGKKEIERLHKEIEKIENRKRIDWEKLRNTYITI